ncbi:DUF2268 domain-containing protein [Planomicrobium okeanokoites]|uniref:DUF2268 domain-containing protein n=1 Tax=Planomicrobium okeanokoites TaxID=244 RepID=UPI00249122AF|nr:DUF2268 domain-containing putative Zn-dependent protease [Planomicrobium okeanokoites]
MDTINHLKKLGAATLLIAFLSGCSSEEPIETDEVKESGEQTPEPEPAVLEVGTQQFKIFSYYDAFDDYVELAKEQPEELDDAYAQTIFHPFRQNAFSEGKGLEYMDLLILTPTQDIMPLQSALAALSDKEAEFQSEIEESLERSAQLLSGDNKTVHIFPANPAYIHGMSPELNARGVALNEEVMILFVHSSLAAEELKHTVAHEYFHLIDMEKGTFESSTAESTLLEATIMEGKAVAFSLLSYPSINLSWISNEDGKVTEQVRTMFINQKDSADMQVWEDFLNGNPLKSIPPFANYIIGHEIMQSFLANHPEMDVNEWLEMSAEEILAGSDFRE